MPKENEPALPPSPRSPTPTPTPIEALALRTVVEGVEAETGEDFYRSLVEHLAEALGVDYAFVSEFCPDRVSFRTRAVWGPEGLLPNLTIAIRGTPCESVLGGGMSHHPERLCELFPQDAGLRAWQAESYCGVPIGSRTGEVVGHLAVMHRRPVRDGERILSILRIFASRARAEFDREHVEIALRENERRYRALYHEAPVGYVAVDAEGCVRQVNDGHARLLGVDPSELVGSSIYRWAGNPGRTRALLRELERGLEGFEGLDIETLHGDRTPFWMRVWLRALRRADGSFDGFRAVTVDVTAEKRAEEALRQSEERYRALYVEAPVGYLFVGTDARIHEVNRGLCRMYGYEPDEMKGRSIYEFDSDGPEGRDRVEALFEEFRAGRERFEGVDFEALRKDGSTFWIRFWADASRNPDGEVDGVRIVAVDVTEERRAREALRESEARHSRIVDSAMDAIVTFDGSGTVEIFNTAAERIFGCGESDAIGRPFARFTTDGFRGALEAAISELSERGSYVWAPDGLQARRADGTEFAVEATVSAVDVGGRRLFTLILRDVDSKRKAEDELRQLHRQKEYLEEEIRAVYNFDEIVGESPRLHDVLREVGLVAPTESSVLILGETGTGKELIARAIHSNGPRRDRPLIKVNCAALPSGLVESELFGHEKGAFTGATERRIGRFELANGGTIFLDEIGELSPEVQVKLLRVLQERELERVGGSRTIRVDVRVIAATNRNLEQGVEEGTFRQDLYYRLSVFPIRLPSLRDRPEDIPSLASYFVARYATKIGRPIERIPDDALDRLLAYPWPGNVRELENVIERAVILTRGRDLEIPRELLLAPTPRRVPEPTATEATASLVEVERRHIVSALERTGWRIEGASGAARLLGLAPSTLRSRMQKLEIRRDASRAA